MQFLSIVYDEFTDEERTILADAFCNPILAKAVTRHVDILTEDLLKLNVNRSDLAEAYRELRDQLDFWYSFADWIEKSRALLSAHM